MKRGIVGVFLSDGGRVFQTFEAEKQKARPPAVFRLVIGIFRSFSDEERSVREARIDK